MTVLVPVLIAVVGGVGLLLAVWGARGRRVLGGGTARVDLGALARAVLAPVAAGGAAYVLTGWLVVGVAAAVFAAGVPRWLQGAGHHRHEIQRVEAIASWAEQLRDTIAAANGLEHALGASAAVAPAPLAPEVGRLVARLEYEPLPSALRAFADEVDHPTADFVVAGLVVAAENEARELAALLGSLALAARAEAQMRARVWAGRARTRTSVRVITACVVLFAAGLMVLDRAYLAPYGTASGQLVLAGVCSVFGGAFVAMDRMGRIELPDRFVARRGADGARR